MCVYMDERWKTHRHTYMMYKIGNQMGYDEAHQTEDGHKQAYVMLR